MRTAFVDALCARAAVDERVFLLTADLGWSVLERFADAFPRRFLNVGVAEQNMLGIAAGLAREGYAPFVYSIATFSSMRGYEQFRNGAVLHRLPVRVIGMGGGFSYGHAGPTHHALEDLAIMRAQPGVTVVAPADSAQTRRAVEVVADLPGPAYLRIDKASCADIAALAGRFALDHPEPVREGRDVLFLATGSITHDALGAADILQRRGVSAAVAVLAHVGFTASWPLCRLLARYPCVVTVEEGNVCGGLGSLVAEAIAEHGLGCRLTRLGVRSSFVEETGSTSYLRGRHEIDPQGLAAAVERRLTRRKAA